jgi:hypothetical protein
MGTFNGHVASHVLDGSTDSQVSGATTAVTVNADVGVPAKAFRHAMLALRCQDGVSGSFGVEVIGAVGGATFIIAGRTAIAAVGNYVLGLTNNQTWGAIENICPRPSKVVFSTAVPISGWTASVYLAGEY